MTLILIGLIVTAITLPIYFGMRDAKRKAKQEKKKRRKDRREAERQAKLDEEEYMTPSHIRWIMDKACLSKKNLSEEEANVVVDRAMLEGRVMYYYKCEFCSSFHMTSRNQNEVHKRLYVC